MIHAERILRDVGLTLDDLQQYKDILDIGAGNCVVGYVANQRGNNVVSVDNECYLGLEDQADYPNFSNQVPYIKTEATVLPFDDESFDFTLASEAPPVLGIQGMTNIRRCIAEILRVTRKEVRIAPISLISTYVIGNSMPQKKKETVYSVDFFKAVEKKSRQLLRDLCPNIEFVDNNYLGYCIIRK